MRQRIHEKRKLDFACLTDATFTLVDSTKPKVAFVLLILPRQFPSNLAVDH